MAGKQIDALTSTRGFAALLIVIFHFGLERFPFVHMQPFFSKGNMGVSYFYVLSGFIMCMVYKQQTISYGGYMKRRMARIAPVYYLAILISILPTIFDHYDRHLPYAKDFWKNVLLSVGFLQSFIPGHAMGVNAPGWSLSVEMFFYLLFPLLLLLYRKNEKRFVWMVLAVFIISQLSHLWLISIEATGMKKLHEFIYYNPINHLNEFTAGMAGCYFYEQSMAHNKLQRWPSILMLLAIIIVVMYLPVSMHNGLLSPLYILFIITVAMQQPRFLNWRPLVYAGEISYGIYILQMPMYYYTGRLNELFMHLQIQEFFYVYLILLFAASAFAYHVIEKPLRKAINRL